MYPPPPLHVQMGQYPPPYHPYNYPAPPYSHYPPHPQNTPPPPAQYTQYPQRPVAPQQPFSEYPLERTAENVYKMPPPMNMYNYPGYPMGYPPYDYYERQR
jgi:hypothetical protein